MDSRTMLEEDEVLSTNLRTARIAAGVSQAELARRSGYSQSLISRFERGHLRPWPRFRAVASEVLGVPEAVLFEDVR